MRAAFNIGLYYEMKDNPATAIEWVEKQINWQKPVRQKLLLLLSIY